MYLMLGSVLPYKDFTEFIRFFKQNFFYKSLIVNESPALTAELKARPKLTLFRKNYTVG